MLRWVASLLFPSLAPLKFKANGFFLVLHVSSFNPVEVCQSSLSLLIMNKLVQKMSLSYFKAQERSQHLYYPKFCSSRS